MPSRATIVDLDHVVAPPAGLVVVRTLPFWSTAAQSEVAGQVRSEMAVVSTDCGLDQLAPPADGFVDVRMFPESSAPMQSEVEGQSIDTGPFDGGSTTVPCQVDAAPAGFVEVRIRPALSLARHSADEGQDDGVSASEFWPPSICWPPFDQVAVPPDEALLETLTSPPEPPVRHNVSDVQSAAVTKPVPDAGVSDVHV
jgi:hypothetical protein